MTDAKRTVPELRFKADDGSDFPDWEEKKLGEVATISKGFTPSTSRDDFWKGDIPWLSIAGFNNKYITNGNKTISDGALGKRRLLPSDSLIMSFKLTLGKLAITKIPLVTNEAICAFDWGKNDINTEYAFYALSRLDFDKFANQAVAGKTLNDESLVALPIPLPSLPEQKKIAEFFSLLDERISKQADKVTSLQEYKKGLSQRIFSRELRFKDENGEDYPEWEEKKLGEVARKITRKNSDMKVTNVISNSAKQGLIPQRDFFDKDIANSANLSGYYVIAENDFVYNPRISSEAPYGPVSRYVLKDSGVVSPLYLCFSLIPGVSIIPQYLEFFFKSSAWHNHIYQNGNSGARSDRVSIKDEDFFSMTLALPSLPEQEKISALLSTMDSKIAKEEEKLAALREQKRGLMQRMFV